MKIRFHQYSEKDFTIDVKKWYGWARVDYYYEGCIIDLHFKSKAEGLDYLRRTMKSNPYRTRILELQTIIVHKTQAGEG